MSEYSVSASALSAYADGTNVTAHNIANVNTQGFDSWRRTYTTGQYGEGVSIQVESPFAVQDTVDFSVLQPSPQDIVADPTLQDFTNTIAQQQNTAFPELPDITDPVTQGNLENNAVDITRESVNLLSDQRAFEANAAVIHAQQNMDEVMLGLIVDQEV